MCDSRYLLNLINLLNLLNLLNLKARHLDERPGDAQQKVADHRQCLVVLVAQRHDSASGNEHQGADQGSDTRAETVENEAQGQFAEGIASDTYVCVCVCVCVCVYMYALYVCVYVCV